MSLVDTLMKIFGFKQVEVVPEKVRKRPKLYEVKPYSYTKNGKLVSVKAHVRGGNKCWQLT